MKVKIIQSCYVPSHPFFNTDDEVEVNDELGRILIKGVLAIEIGEVNNEVDYSEYSTTELRKLLKEKGLSSEGKKADLIKRLVGDE